MNALEKAQACPIHTAVAEHCIQFLKVPMFRVSYEWAVKKARQAPNLQAFSTESLVGMIGWKNIQKMVEMQTGWMLIGVKPALFETHDPAEEHFPDRVGSYSAIGGIKQGGFARLCDENAHLFIKKEASVISRNESALNGAKQRIKEAAQLGIEGLPRGHITMEYGYETPPFLPSPPELPDDATIEERRQASQDYLKQQADANRRLREELK